MMSENKYGVTLTTTVTHTITKSLGQDPEDRGDLTIRRDYVLTVESRIPGPITAEFLYMAADAAIEAGAPADAFLSLNRNAADGPSMATVEWSRVSGARAVWGDAEEPNQ